MATPTADTYSAASGATVYAGRSAAWPAWRTALAQWQWVELTGAKFSDCLPSPTPSGDIQGRMQAWNSFVVKGTKIITAGIGGHSDWAGNEAVQIELGVNSPTTPTLLKTATLAAYYVEDADYYSDTPPSPTSSHTYWSLHYNAARNKVFRMGVGSGWGSGNWVTPNVDAFDLTANEWDAANTWTDVPLSPGSSYPQVKHPTTEDVYIWVPTSPTPGLYRWNSSNATFTFLCAPPSGGDQFVYRCGLIDVGRNRLVFMGDDYNANCIRTYNLANDTFSSAIPLTNDTYKSRITERAGNMAHYDAGLDKYIVRCTNASVGGAKLTGGEILTVDPTTWATDVLTTTSGSGIPSCSESGLAGVYGRFQPMPDLGGYAYIPNPDNGVFFLASS